MIPGPLKKRCPRSKTVTLISGSVKIPICGDLEVVSRSGLPDLPRFWSSINTKLPTEKGKTSKSWQFVIFTSLFLECVGFDFVVNPISFPGTGPQRWNSGVFSLFYPQFPLFKGFINKMLKDHQTRRLTKRNPIIPPLEAIVLKLIALKNPVIISCNVRNLWMVVNYQLQLKRISSINNKMHPTTLCTLIYVHMYSNAQCPPLFSF